MTIAACRPSRRVVHVCPPFVFHGHGRNRTYLLDGLVKVIVKIVKSQLRWMTPPFWSFRAYILGESKSDFATIYDFACHACARAPCRTIGQMSETPICLPFIQWRAHPITQIGSYTPRKRLRIIPHQRIIP